MIMVAKQETASGAAAERLQAVLHAVDTLKSDLTRCGMRLQEAAALFRMPLIVPQENGVKIIHGTGSGRTCQPAFRNDRCLHVPEEAGLPAARTALVYNADQQSVQQSLVAGIGPDCIFLKERLCQDFWKGSWVVTLREVEYRFAPDRGAILRRVDSGPLRVQLEGVSSFHLAFFQDSRAALYRIQLDGDENIRGYVYLVNLL